MSKNEVYTVTTLPESPEEERDRRFKVYLWSMMVRLVSLPLVFIVPLPWVVVPILFAVFIPAFAVVSANVTGSKVGNDIVKPIASLTSPTTNKL